MSLTAKNNSLMYPKGSEWRKWDLHVHTPASALGHSLGEDWEAYVQRLIEAGTEHDLAAIATADYFTIDGYRKLLSFYDSGKNLLLANGNEAKLFLIPGVELRLNNFNSENESINLHVLFDPNRCSPDFIESNFLEELKVNYRGQTYSLKEQNILAIGKSILEASEIDVGQDFSGINDQQCKKYKRAALGAITLSKRDINEALEEIDRVFQRQKLPPKTYLVAIVGKGRGGIQKLKWFEENREFSRAGLVREDITHQADIIFSNDKDDRDFYLGRKVGTSEEEFKIRFEHLKPCVWGSDSKSLETLLHPSNGTSSDYTWIKAETTFEGLKQIIYEPELRVRVQKDDPRERETFARVDYCSVNFPEAMRIVDNESEERTDFCLRGKYTIHFSNNLTCIVGGRGDGKSTLVHVLYNACDRKESDRLRKVASPLLDLELGNNPLARIEELTQTEVPVGTEFFLQNETEKFAKDIEKMSILVRNRINRLSFLESDKKSLKSLEDDWFSAANSIDKLIDAYENITSSNAQIEALKKEIGTLKKQAEVIKSDPYKKLQKDIEQISSSIATFKAYESQYQELSEDITTLLNNVKLLDWSQFDNQKVLTELTEFLEDYKNRLEARFAESKQKYDQNGYAAKLEEKKLALKKYLEAKGLSAENIEELTDATEQINDLRRRVKSFERAKLPYMKTYKQRKAVLQFYKERYDAYKNRFFEVTSELEKGLSGLPFSAEKLSITFRPKTNYQLLKDAAVQFVKNNNPSRTSLSTDNIQNVLFGEEIISEFIKDSSKIKEAVNKSQRATIHTQVLQELVNDRVFLERLYLRMYKQYFDIRNIQVQTRLGEKLLQNTSFGERCGIVIAIILVAGTNPIVIDQPEDNLDGKFVSQVLVPLLRKQKLNRQIILVTRDANIVIGGDAELIHILEGGDRTEIIPSTIENTQARPKYIWILDGGEKAFQERERKYNLTVKL